MELLSPPGSATPLHRHREEDEAFYILSGTAEFHCDASTLTGGPGDFLFLPVGLPHAYIVGPDEPLRLLALSGSGAPSGFDKFVQQAGNQHKNADSLTLHRSTRKPSVMPQSNTASRFSGHLPSPNPLSTMGWCALRADQPARRGPLGVTA